MFATHLGAFETPRRDRLQPAIDGPVGGIAHAALGGEDCGRRSMLAAAPDGAIADAAQSALALAPIDRNFVRNRRRSAH